MAPGCAGSGTPLTSHAQTATPHRALSSGNPHAPSASAAAPTAACQFPPYPQARTKQPYAVELGCTRPEQRSSKRQMHCAQALARMQAKRAVAKHSALCSGPRARAAWPRESTASAPRQRPVAARAFMPAPRTAALASPDASAARSNSRAASHSPQRLHATMAALQATASAGKRSSPISCSSASAACHWKHFSQALMQAEYATTSGSKASRRTSCRSPSAPCQCKPASQEPIAVQ
mmetsp:Transcript_36578/g.113842  ORF Transcript_36578/g.113842 Transcript_36578/m.113842 type:complete len:235 (+) Transcript_36578:171-875(+)